MGLRIRKDEEVMWEFKVFIRQRDHSKKSNVKPELVEGVIKKTARTRFRQAQPDNCSMINFYILFTHLALL